MYRSLILSCYLLTSSSILYSASSYSSEKTNAQLMAEIKAELENELTATDKVDKKFHLYNMAANELMSYQFYKEAQLYLRKAIELETSIDKSFSYINLLSVTQSLGDKKEVLSAYNESRNYFEKTKKIQEPAIADYLTTYESYLFPEKKVTTNSTLYKTFALEEKIKALIEKKEYAQALLQFKDTNIDQIKDGKLQITYDLLRIHQKKDSPLLCEKEYAKYPNAVTYLSIYCKLLKEKKNEIKISSAEKKTILDYLGQKENKDSSYLLALYKELK